MADSAARAVERRAESFLGSLYLGEVIQSGTELGELHRRDSRQGTTDDTRLRLALHLQHNGRAPHGRRQEGQPFHRAPLVDGSRTTSTARMKLCPAPHIRLHSIV